MNPQETVLTSAATLDASLAETAARLETLLTAPTVQIDALERLLAELRNADCTVLILINTPSIKALKLFDYPLRYPPAVMQTILMHLEPGEIVAHLGKHYDNIPRNKKMRLKPSASLNYLTTLILQLIKAGKITPSVLPALLYFARNQLDLATLVAITSVLPALLSFASEQLDFATFSAMTNDRIQMLPSRPFEEYPKQQYIAILSLLTGLQAMRVSLLATRQPTLDEMLKRLSVKLIQALFTKDSVHRFLNAILSTLAKSNTRNTEEVIIGERWLEIIRDVPLDTPFQKALEPQLNSSKLRTITHQYPAAIKRREEHATAVAQSAMAAFGTLDYTAFEDRLNSLSNEQYLLFISADLLWNHLAESPLSEANFLAYLAIICKVARSYEDQVLYSATLLYILSYAQYLYLSKKPSDHIQRFLLAAFNEHNSAGHAIDLNVLLDGCVNFVSIASLLNDEALLSAIQKQYKSQGKLADFQRLRAQHSAAPASHEPADSETLKITPILKPDAMATTPPGTLYHYFVNYLNSLPAFPRKFQADVLGIMAQGRDALHRDFISRIAAAPDSDLNSLIQALTLNNESSKNRDKTISAIANAFSQTPDPLAVTAFLRLYAVLYAEKDKFNTILKFWSDVLSEIARTQSALFAKIATAIDDIPEADAGALALKWQLQRFVSPAEALSSLIDVAVPAAAGAGGLQAKVKTRRPVTTPQAKPLDPRALYKDEFVAALAEVRKIEAVLARLKAIKVHSNFKEMISARDQLLTLSQSLANSWHAFHRDPMAEHIALSSFKKLQPLGKALTDLPFDQETRQAIAELSSGLSGLTELARRLAGRAEAVPIKTRSADLAAKYQTVVDALAPATVIKLTPPRKSRAAKTPSHLTEAALTPSVLPVPVESSLSLAETRFLEIVQSIGSELRKLPGPIEAADPEKSAALAHYQNQLSHFLGLVDYCEEQILSTAKRLPGPGPFLPKPFRPSASTAIELATLLAQMQDLEQWWNRTLNTFARTPVLAPQEQYANWLHALTSCYIKIQDSVIYDRLGKQFPHCRILEHGTGIFSSEDANDEDLIIVYPDSAPLLSLRSRVATTLGVAEQAISVLFQANCLEYKIPRDVYGNHKAVDLHIYSAANFPADELAFGSGSSVGLAKPVLDKASARVYLGHEDMHQVLNQIVETDLSLAELCADKFDASIRNRLKISLRCWVRHYGKPCYTIGANLGAILAAVKHAEHPARALLMPTLLHIHSLYSAQRPVQYAAAFASLGLNAGSVAAAHSECRGHSIASVLSATGNSGNSSPTSCGSDGSGSVGSGSTETAMSALTLGSP